jgi:hypothetical protein
MLELQVSSGLYTHIDGPHSRIPVGSFKIGWIVKTRQPHISNAVREDLRVTDHAWAKRESMQAFAEFPLIAKDRLVGVLFSRNVLEDSVIEELLPLAEALSQFLERHRAHQELTRTEALRAERIFGYSRSAALRRQMADLIIPARLREASS